MKTTLPLIFTACLLIGCEDTRPIKSLCGCENVRVSELEKEYGVLNGKTITIFEYGGMARVFRYTAGICNPEVLDSLRVSPEEVEVLFSGDLFQNCDSTDTANREAIHLREIALYKD